MSSIIHKINLLPVWRGTLRVWGFRLFANSFDRLLYLWLHRLDVMGRSERDTLAKWLQPGMRVLDIGANIGLYSLFMASKVGPDGLVHAFEPVPRIFESLSRAQAANHATNLRCYPVAVGDQAGELTLWCRAVNSGDTRPSPGRRPAASIRVPVVRLDDRTDLERIDFVKIDVQGFELHALRGMERLLSGDHSMKLLFEYWPEGLADAGAGGEELLQLIRGHGFAIHEIERDGSLRELKRDAASSHRGRPTSGWRNLLACRG